MIKKPILHDNHWGLKTPYQGNYWDIKTPCQGNCWDIKNPCQGNYWDIKTPCQGNYWDKKNPYQGNYWDIETPYMGYDWDILVPCMGLVAFSQSGKFTLKTQRNPSNIPFFYQIGNYQKFPVPSENKYRPYATKHWLLLSGTSFPSTVKISSLLPH